MYHWEATQEDFLVLSGEALLIVEGKERRLQQWDFVHCPRLTKHIIVGAGDRPCAVLAVGAREHRPDEVGAAIRRRAARRHGAGVYRETNDADVPLATCRRANGPDTARAGSVADGRARSGRPEPRAQGTRLRAPPVRFDRPR